MAQAAPLEYLDIFFDIPGFWVGKTHDDLEEFLTVCLGLGDCQRAETL